MAETNKIVKETTATTKIEEATEVETMETEDQTLVVMVTNPDKMDLVHSTTDLVL